MACRGAVVGDIAAVAEKECVVRRTVTVMRRRQVDVELGRRTAGSTADSGLAVPAWRLLRALGSVCRRFGSGKGKKDGGQHQELNLNPQRAAS